MITPIDLKKGEPWCPHCGATTLEGMNPDSIADVVAAIEAAQYAANELGGSYLSLGHEQMAGFLADIDEALAKLEAQS